MEYAYEITAYWDSKEKKSRQHSKYLGIVVDKEAKIFKKKEKKHSEDNIKELYTEKIDFLTRLPSRRTLYKDLIKEAVPDIETFENAVKYGDRILFVEHKKVNLFGNEGYAHIVLDPERKGRKQKSC